MTKSNNEWVPEVGQECEISNCGNPFEWCVIKYLGEQLIVVDHKSHIDQHYHVGSFVLRPIKTEAEKRREELIVEALTYVKHDYSPDSLEMASTKEYVIDAVEQLVDANWIKPKPLTGHNLKDFWNSHGQSWSWDLMAERINSHIRGDGL